MKTIFTYNKEKLVSEITDLVNELKCAFEDSIIEYMNSDEFESDDSFDLPEYYSEKEESVIKDISDSVHNSIEFINNTNCKYQEKQNIVSGLITYSTFLCNEDYANEETIESILTDNYEMVNW